MQARVAQPRAAEVGARQVQALAGQAAQIEPGQQRVLQRQPDGAAPLFDEGCQQRPAVDPGCRSARRGGHRHQQQRIGGVAVLDIGHHQTGADAKAPEPLPVGLAGLDQTAWLQRSGALVGQVGDHRLHALDRQLALGRRGAAGQFGQAQVGHAVGARLHLRTARRHLDAHQQVQLPRLAV